MSAASRTDSSSADSDAVSEPQELLATVRSVAVNLMEKLEALQVVQPEPLPALWTEHVAAVQEIVQILDGDMPSMPDQRRRPSMSLKQRREFGLLLRDRRNEAGLSRLQLARKAQLSDATVKFIETAHHLPSRASLLRLINVPALRLRWADVPGQPSLPSANRAGHLAAYHGMPATSDESSIGLERMDFDELGDPVFVRRFLGAEFLPMRR